MTEPTPSTRRTFEVAELVRGLLKERGIEAAVIGAIASAALGYARATEDFDLATHAHPYPALSSLARDLVARGFDAEFVDPEAGDPLGGVVNVRGDGFDLVQVVNFFNPYDGDDRLAKEAIAEAKAGVLAGTAFRVVDLPHLIALKLNTGGPRDRQDVAALLEHNAPLDLAPVRDVCGRHGLGPALEAVIAELGADRLEGRTSGV